MRAPPSDVDVTGIDQISNESAPSKFDDRGYVVLNAAITADELDRFWHGDLVHAGGGIQDYGRTRKSFVVHYARVHDAVPSQDPSRSKRQHLGGWYYAKETPRPVSGWKARVRRLWKRPATD